MDDRNAELAMAELERGWAARRSDLSQRLDAAVQGAIAGVLDVAGQLRQAMEQDAAGALERVRRERIAIAQEVAQLRAEQAGLGTEIASARQRAEQEAAAIRRAAQAEGEALLRDAEQRRVELIEEIARLEQQLVQVSSGIQALLQEQIGRVRAGIPAAEQLWTPSAVPGPVGPGSPRPAATQPAPPLPSTSPPRPAPAPEPAVDPTAAPGPTAAELAPELDSDRSGTGLEVLDEGELFDLAATRAGEPSLDEELAELEIDAPLAPSQPGETELAALGLDDLEAEPAPVGPAPRPRPGDAAPADRLTGEAETTDDLDAELAALDAELAFDPMEAAPGPAVETAPEPVTAADARSALLASLSGLGLARDEVEEEEPAAEGAAAGGTAARGPVGGERPAGRGSTAELAPSPAEPSSAGSAEPSRPASAPAAGTTRVEVAVTGTPSFARALELQRGIQRTEGVKQVQALQFERGTLVLSVEHEGGLDLVDALQALPNNLELVERAGGRLELRFPGIR
ncbi:MAG TPA: hypothetical protein VGL23_21955 [Chloroflexota bacterium]